MYPCLQVDEQFNCFHIQSLPRTAVPGYAISYIEFQKQVLCSHKMWARCHEFSFPSSFQKFAPPKLFWSPSKQKILWKSSGNNVKTIWKWPKRSFYQERIWKVCGNNLKTKWKPYGMDVEMPLKGCGKDVESIWNGNEIKISLCYQKIEDSVGN